MMPFQYGEGK
jgi:hypothetical protein